MYNTIVTQLEKALECKDDKELRLRVEVLLDIIKESRPAQTPTFPQTFPQPQPLPQPTYYEANKITVETKQPKINGAGAILSKGEQINYTRPKGT